MVGMSTSGSGETGSLKNATAPATTSPNDSSVVATGRRIKGVDRLITYAIEVVAAQLLSVTASMQKPLQMSQGVTGCCGTPAATSRCEQRDRNEDVQIKVSGRISRRKNVRQKRAQNHRTRRA